MSNLKISQLTSGTPAQSTDLLPIDRAGANFSVTAGSIAALAGTASNLKFSPIVLSGGTDAIPAHTPGTYVVTTAGVDAMTIAAPTVTTDDGIVIKVTISTNAAHTITFTAGSFRHGTTT